MINKRIPSLVPVIALAAGMAVVGCKKKEPEPAAKAKAEQPAAEKKADDKPKMKVAEPEETGGTKTLTKHDEDGDDEDGDEDEEGDE